MSLEQIISDNLVKRVNQSKSLYVILPEEFHLQPLDCLGGYVSLQEESTRP